MLTIEYTPTGIAYSDFEVDKKSKQIIDAHLEHYDKQDIIYRTSTESLIKAIRAYIVENRINTDEVLIQFKFGEELMPVNKFGNPNYWPNGFCDLNDNILRRTLKAQLKIKKELREG